MPQKLSFEMPRLVPFPFLIHLGQNIHTAPLVISGL